MSGDLRRTGTEYHHGRGYDERDLDLRGLHGAFVLRAL